MDNEQPTDALSEDEFNNMLDEWVIERNKSIGEVHIPHPGLFPPDLGVGLHGCLNNELVTTDLIRHYAYAIGDMNPLWLSEAYARSTRWGGIIAPPKFIDCIAPTFMHDERNIPPGAIPLVAGSKCQWFRIIRPGDRFRVVDKFLGITEKKHKEKRPYRLFIDTTRRTYINQRDEIVAVVDAPCVITSSSREEKTKSAYQIKEKHKYSQEELETIYRAYDEEKRRGSETLYWEDVVVGEELKPIVAGPFDATDSTMFIGAIGYFAAFRAKWELMKADMKWTCVDNETNALHFGVEGHLRDIAAHSMTGTNAFSMAAQSEGLICHLLTNWMGDDGFLKVLECRMSRQNFLGDTSWIQGKVTGKSVDNGEHLVDLEVRCQNQDGAIYMTGNATVRLISRTDA